MGHVQPAQSCLVGYLTRLEINAILAANNLSEWSGRRDHVLLLTLYNTGARVSEITSLDQTQFILQQVAARAAASCPSLSSKHVCPHLFRQHTCAFHPLQSGVDIAVIALWLSHESIQTTHGYIEADLLIIRSKPCRNWLPPANPQRNLNPTTLCLDSSLRSNEIKCGVKSSLMRSHSGSSQFTPHFIVLGISEKIVH
jgi:integrase